MEKLKIRYVRRLPHQPEDLPTDIVEVYLAMSGGNVDLIIGRHNYVATNRAVQAIAERVQQLAEDAAVNHRSLAERIGLLPTLSASWRRFLDNLLQREESWAFLVQPGNFARSN